MEKELLPREKLLIYGEETLEDKELLAIILRRGIKDKNVFELSEEIIDKHKDFVGLQKLDLNELIKIKGVGKVAAINLKAALEMGKRFHLQKLKTTYQKIKSPEDVYNISQDMIYFEKEFVRVYLLDSKLNVIHKENISEGTANSSIAHPRDIFKSAIKLNAVSFILVHNHPSGDSSPSIQDIELTDKIKEAGKILGIKLNDHIIVGKNQYYSFNLSRKVEKNV
ncbi:MAG: RadC family protein [Thermotogota bacterium]